MLPETRLDVPIKIIDRYRFLANSTYVFPEAFGLLLKVFPYCTLKRLLSDILFYECN